MVSKFRVVALLVSGLALVPPSAFADVVGTVLQMKTPAGSVMVVRGAQTYALAEGDQIFDGDQIFTRVNGAVEFSTPTCNKQLGGASSIVVDAQVCAATPISLTNKDVVGGVTIGTSNGIGATPILLGLLAAGGGVAAASSNGGSSASP